jgi:hypothetical protein
METYASGKWTHATKKSTESWSDEMDRVADRDNALVKELEARGEYVKSTEHGKETASRLFEENVNAVREYRWREQAELAHFNSRFVNIMHQSEFLRKLNLVGELADFRASYNDFAMRGLRGLNIAKRDGSRKKYSGVAIQEGWMPEFSLMYFDEHFVPTKERFRGWRTVLLRLIDAGFANEEQMHSIFGKPTDGIGSRRYREELFLTRNYGQKPNPWAAVTN